MRPLLPLLAAALALTACHHPVAGGVALQDAAGLGVLADVPDIARQIAVATMGKDELGTRVNKLPVPNGEKAVTFLTYKALDNNLTSTANEHVNLLERTGSSTNVNALALVDGEGAANTRRYYVRQDRDDAKVTSPYLNAAGDVNTASETTLRVVTRWAFAGNYPAKLKWLDINNHGHGAFGIADDVRSGQQLSLPALARAIAAGAGQKLDVLSFDACLMASAEVACDMQGVAKYMVASEDQSYAVGMDYDKTLAALAKKPVAPLELARALATRSRRRGDDARIFTISVIDLDEAGHITEAVDGLGRALLAALPTQGAAIRRAVAEVPRFFLAGEADEGMRDLGDFAQRLQAKVADPAVQRACHQLQDVLVDHKRAVRMNWTADGNATARGLSIYLPADGAFDARYRETGLARKTRWDEFLLALRK